MRKLQRLILRRQAEKYRWGIEGFRYLWKNLRKKQGKSYYGRRGKNHDITLRRGMRKKKGKTAGSSGNRIHMTGNTMPAKRSWWKKLINWIKNLGGKSR